VKHIHPNRDPAVRGTRREAPDQNFAMTPSFNSRA
jgi:hypothetical protein